MLAPNQILDPLHCLRRIQQHPRQRVVVRKPIGIFRNDHVQPTIGRLNVANLQNFHVVAHDVSCQTEWTDVNDLDIWIS